MTPLSIFIFCVLTGMLCYLLLTPRGHRRLPPGPRALPVIGNLHMLGSNPHRALQTLARKYGPIMSVRLGQVPTVVISSPAMAEQVLKTHDAVFASRPRIQAAEYLSYGARGPAFIAYGPYWRFMRKICTLKLLSATRIESFAPMRREVVSSMVERLRKAAEKNEVVNLSEIVSELVEELNFRMFVGSDFDTIRFKALAKEALCLIGRINLADFIPILGLLDLQGLKRKMVKMSRDIDKILDKLVDEVQQRCMERRQLGGENETPMSFIEVLISLANQSTSNNSHDDQDQDYIGPTDAKAIGVDLIAASLDTTVNAIEWMLSELLRDPKVMARVQQELRDVVGVDKMVEEVDLQKLTYFEMVIMENFRLHPSPFLVPHESIEDVEISGYFIPKKTRVLINNWAISKDPDVWSDNVEQFIPERFANSEMTFRGNDFRFIPFGSGRRGCPGMQLGLTTVRFVVAQLVHCFNWKLPNEILPSELDMTDKFGLNLTRVNHLLAVPTYRLPQA